MVNDYPRDIVWHVYIVFTKSENIFLNFTNIKILLLCHYIGVDRQEKTMK
jgi:hypothetical protein